MPAWFAIELGLLALNLAIREYRSWTQEKARAASLNDFTFPRAEEGDAIALVYGTVRIDSPQVIYFRLDTAEELPGGGGLGLAGYAYPFHMRLLLGRTNAQVTMADPPQAQLVGMFIGDKRVTLEGPNQTGIEGGEADSPGNATYRLDEPSGSVTEGRIHGYLAFYDGRWDLVRRGDDGDVGHIGLDDINVPYRGFITLWLSPMRVEAAQIPTIAPIVFNPCLIPGHEAVSGALGMGDVNPAAILRDLLSNPWGGVGNDTAIIDDDSFAEVAATLADEEFGMSLYVAKPNAARDVIEEILRTIDGFLIQNMNTGKYELRLVREDYNPATLPEFTVDNVLEAPEMPSMLWAETYNEVRVMFTEPGTGHRPSTATAQDDANINANGGRIRPLTVTYSGVRNPNLANRLANRDLAFVSRPIASLRMVVNRDGWNLRPGDPFRFTWSRWAGGVSIVFRVMQVDVGTLTDGRITVDAVQDRFAGVGNIWDPPIIDEVDTPPATPTPITDRVITEAPRWIQQQAYDEGLINNPAAQRGYYLAAPAGSDSRYRVDTAINAAAEVADLPAKAFPVTFTLAASYARSTAPYDVTTGILVENVTGGSLGSATATQIREEGRNLFQVGGEIMAYEAAADLGGGTYQLQNVWRGLLDTVPADHAGGAAGYVLPGAAGVSALGKVRLRHGATVATHTPAAAGSTWTPSAFSPADTFTARSRVLLPARVADVKLNGSRTPAALEEDGVAFQWGDRNATTPTIVRGDDADEDGQAGQITHAVGYKDGGPQVLIAYDHSDHAVKLGTGIVGHGLLELGVDTTRPVDLPDGTTPSLGGWQVPTVQIQAHHWRQLLINPSFGSGSTGWTVIDAGGTVASGSAGLGGAGSYLTGATGLVTWQQTVDVTGYTGDLAAVLDFHVAAFTDVISSDDTITVLLEELDSNGDPVSDTTYGPSRPVSVGTWAMESLTLATSRACCFLRVTVTLTPNGVGVGPDTMADVGITGLDLRYGQVSDQLLANPSFESGVGVDWDTVTGTWQLLGTAPKYDGSGYARPNDHAAAELAQTVTLPAGHAYGVALLKFAFMLDAGSDTGETILEALDGGGAVLADETTGVMAQSPGGWVRWRVVMDPIPAGTASLRVRNVATRVAGTELNTCWDNFDLRCHKHLDPDDAIEAAWDASVAQPLPRSAAEWRFTIPTVPPPDYAIYDGAYTGKLGIEPVLQAAGAGAFTTSTCVAYDGTTRLTTGYEAPGGAGACIEAAPAGTAFANFGAADDFTVLAFFRIRPDAALADGFGIVGRMADGVGWQLRVTDTDAYPMVRLVGADGTIDIAGTVPCADGALHGCALVYDHASPALWLHDAQGAHDDSPVAAGEFRSAVPGKLRILAAAEAEAEQFQGQILRVYIWRQALTEAQIADVLSYRASDPTGLIASDGRTGTVAAVTATGATGAIAETFGPSRTAIAYDATATRHGLLVMPAIANLATGAASADDGTVEDGAAADPFGFRQAIRIEGNDAQGRMFAGMALGGAGPVYVTWFARAATAHDAVVALVDSGGADDATTTVSLTTTWQAFTWTAAWTDPLTDGVGGVRFAGSDDGTDREIYLSPTWCAALAPTYPGTFPIGTPGATVPRLDVSTLTAQANAEGELVVEVSHLDADVILADLSNGADDNDRRVLAWSTAGPAVTGIHHDATGTDDVTAAIATAVDPTAPYEAALRWNQAETFGGGFDTVRTEQASTVETDAGRGATFTASAVPVERLDVGHGDGADVMAGLVYRVEVSVRERKL